jgi:hypothetical protein
MLIPAFVEAGRKTKKAKASARLKFVLTNLAAQHTSRSSMRALANLVGLDHSTLSTYIRRGSFSKPAADRIEERIGAVSNITAAELIDPMIMERVAN